jgi:hypothetical protein
MRYVMIDTNLGETHMARIGWLVVALVTATCVHAQDNSIPLQAQVPPPELNARSDVQRLSAWLVGEFDNNEQAWWENQAPADRKPKQLHEHKHVVITKAAAPFLGENVFIAKDALVRDTDAAEKLRILQLVADPKTSAVRMDFYTFNEPAKFSNVQKKPELLAGLSSKQLKLQIGCTVFWRFDAKAMNFAGSVKPGTCVQKSSGGKSVTNDEQWTLNASGLTVLESGKDSKGNVVSGRSDGQPLALRRVRYFDGWAAIARGGKTDVLRDKWSGQKGVIIHNEGQTLKILWDDGKPTGYSMQLAQLTYQGTSVPILKLAVINDETGKSETYVWTNTEAKRIGVNMGWLQVGLVERENNAFGW